MREREGDRIPGCETCEWRRAFQLMITPRVSRFPPPDPARVRPASLITRRRSLRRSEVLPGVAWDRTPGTRRARPRRTRGTRKSIATGWDTPPTCPRCPGMGKGGTWGGGVRGGREGRCLRGEEVTRMERGGRWGSSVAHPVGAFLADRVIMVKDVVADVDDSLLERRQGVGPVVPRGARRESRLNHPRENLRPRGGRRGERDEHRERGEGEETRGNAHRERFVEVLARRRVRGGLRTPVGYTLASCKGLCSTLLVSCPRSNFMIRSSFACCRSPPPSITARRARAPRRPGGRHGGGPRPSRADVRAPHASTVARACGRVGGQGGQAPVQRRGACLPGIPTPPTRAPLPRRLTLPTPDRSPGAAQGGVLADSPRSHPARQTRPARRPRGRVSVRREASPPAPPRPRTLACGHPPSIPSQP